MKAKMIEVSAFENTRFFFSLYVFSMTWASPYSLQPCQFLSLLNLRRNYGYSQTNKQKILQLGKKPDFFQKVFDFKEFVNI